MKRPWVVTGYRSPYPTVVTVVAAPPQRVAEGCDVGMGRSLLSVENRHGAEPNGYDRYADDVRSDSTYE